jgi:hypothetical protein
MEEYKFQETGVAERLVNEGFMEATILTYTNDRCLGCGCLRSHCQCPFTGSAHPSQEERYTLVKRQLQTMELMYLCDLALNAYTMVYQQSGKPGHVDNPGPLGPNYKGVWPTDEEYQHYYIRQATGYMDSLCELLEKNMETNNEKDTISYPIPF